MFGGREPLAHMDKKTRRMARRVLLSELSFQPAATATPALLVGTDAIVLRICDAIW